ncbi:MAG: nucleoside transporter [bacterium]|nr:nucleoside transporter [bacterium]
MCGPSDISRPDLGDDDVARRALIVVFDEDEALREALRFSLETEGYRVLAFGQSEDLLESIRDRGVACFVIDEAGCDHRLRGALRGSKVPVILLSTGGAPRLRRAGRIRVVDKPLITDALSRQIAEALSAH